MLVTTPYSSRTSRGYLESTSQAVHAVVGFFRRQTLESELDNVVFFGDDVVGPADRERSAHRSEAAKHHKNPFREFPHGIDLITRVSIPQSQLPVARSVGVPVGERLHPSRQPWAGLDVRGEGGCRHGVAKL